MFGCLDGKDDAGNEEESAPTQAEPEGILELKRERKPLEYRISFFWEKFLKFQVQYVQEGFYITKVLNAHQHAHFY